METEARHAAALIETYSFSTEIISFNYNNSCSNYCYIILLSDCQSITVKTLLNPLFECRSSDLEVFVKYDLN